MVYLLHFVDDQGRTARLGGHCGHYLGWTPDERRTPDNSRFQKHLAGKGSAATRAWVKGWTDRDGVFHPSSGHLLWTPLVPGGDRKLERQLKRQRNHKRFCPWCKSEGRNLTHVDELL